MGWNLDTELAVVMITGLLGAFGVIIAAILTRNRLSKTSGWDGVERRSISMCPEHSGVMATIAASNEAMRQMHEDIRELKDEIIGLRDSIRILMMKVPVEK